MNPRKGRLSLPARFDGGERGREWATASPFSPRSLTGGSTRGQNPSNRREVVHRRESREAAGRSGKGKPAAKAERERRIIGVRPAPTILAAPQARRSPLAHWAQFATIDTLRPRSDNDTVASKWSRDNQLRCHAHRLLSRPSLSPRFFKPGARTAQHFCPQLDTSFQPQRAPR